MHAHTHKHTNKQAHVTEFCCLMFSGALNHLCFLPFPIALALKKTFVWWEQRHYKFPNNHKTPGNWVNEHTQDGVDFIFFRPMNFISVRGLIIAFMFIFFFLDLGPWLWDYYSFIEKEWKWKWNESAYQTAHSHILHNSSTSKTILVVICELSVRSISIISKYKLPNKCGW